MNQCGFWAHCAHHCDLACDHNEWCPGFPVNQARTLGPAMRARLLRWAVRATLTALGHRLDKHVCRFANETGSDDD